MPMMWGWVLISLLLVVTVLLFGRRRGRPFHYADLTTDAHTTGPVQDDDPWPWAKRIVLTATRLTTTIPAPVMAASPHPVALPPHYPSTARSRRVTYEIARGSLARRRGCKWS